MARIAGFGLALLLFPQALALGEDVEEIEPTVPCKASLDLANRLETLAKGIRRAGDDVPAEKLMELAKDVRDEKLKSSRKPMHEKKADLKLLTDQDTRVDAVSMQRKFTLKLTVFEAEPELLTQFDETKSLQSETKQDADAGAAVRPRVLQRARLNQFLDKHDGTLAAKVAQLKQTGQIKVLAAPTLSVSEGKSANMLAGGEFPILVPQKPGTTKVEWHELGVRVNCLVSRLEDERLRIETKLQVQERTHADAISVNGIVIPDVVIRRFDVASEVRPQQGVLLSMLQGEGRILCLLMSLDISGELSYLGTETGTGG